MEIDIPALAALDRLLGLDRNTDPEVRRERQKAFVLMAVEELAEWANGQRRFASVSELDRHRVNALFRDVRKDAVPSVQTLVADLKLSESRALAMIGRMRYGEAAWIEERAMAELVAQIDKRLADPSGHTTDHGITTITLPPTLHRQMRERRKALYDQGDGRAVLATYTAAQDDLGFDWAATDANWVKVKDALLGKAATSG